MGEVVQYPYNDGVVENTTFLKGGRRGGFSMVFHAGIMMVTRLKLTARQHCVLLGLIARIGYGSKVWTTQAELGRVIGMKQQSVSVALRGLEKAGLVRRIKNGWEIDGRLAWRGPLKGRREKARG